MYDLINYTTESGRCPVEDYLRALNKKNKIGDIRTIKLYLDRLKELGMAINQQYPNSIRKIRDELWEIRPGGNRIFFFHYDGNKFVLLHAFKKQSQETPKAEIERAMAEIKDYRRRNNDRQKF